MVLQAFVQGLQPGRQREHIHLSSPRSLTRPNGQRACPVSHQHKASPLTGWRRGNQRGGGANCFRDEVPRESIGPTSYKSSRCKVFTQVVANHGAWLPYKLCKRRCEGLKGEPEKHEEHFSDIVAARDKDCTRTNLVQRDIDSGDPRPIRRSPWWLPLAKQNRRFERWERQASSSPATACRQHLLSWSRRKMTPGVSASTTATSMMPFVKTLTHYHVCP